MFFNLPYYHTLPYYPFYPYYHTRKSSIDKLKNIFIAIYCLYNRVESYIHWFLYTHKFYVRIKRSEIYKYKWFNKITASRIRRCLLQEIAILKKRSITNPLGFCGWSCSMFLEIITHRCKPICTNKRHGQDQRCRIYEKISKIETMDHLALTAYPAKFDPLL